MSGETMLNGDTSTTSAPNAEGTAPASQATDPAKPAEGSAAPAPEKPAGAPEKYDFKPPEGVEVDAEVTTEFEGIARELGLPQEGAQKLYEFGAKVTERITSKMSAALEEMQAGWKEATTKDPEFGGEKLNENLGHANKALTEFGSPELKKLLVESKLGDHPEVVRLFVKLGKAMAEDRFVKGGAAPAQKSPYFSYPNSKHN